MPSTISNAAFAPRDQAGGHRKEAHPSSATARRWMQSIPGEPFWLCAWRDVVFLHFEVDRKTLQAEVPFELDSFENRVFVSLVAFTLHGMRPRSGGRLTRHLFRPWGTHRFLNVRTYVRAGGSRGIYFLAEWLDAPWIDRWCGPLLYGLPFRFGRLDFDNTNSSHIVRGCVTHQSGCLEYSGTHLGLPRSASPGTAEAFLLERYLAFTHRLDVSGWFPVWHLPWSTVPVRAELHQTTLLRTTGAWFDSATFRSAHWSAGSGETWMGRHYRMSHRGRPIGNELPG